MYKKIEKYSYIQYTNIIMVSNINDNTLNTLVDAAIQASKIVETSVSSKVIWEPNFETTKTNYKMFTLEDKQRLFKIVSTAWVYNNIHHKDKKDSIPYLGITNKAIINNTGWVLFKNWKFDWKSKVDWTLFLKEFKVFIDDNENTDEDSIIIRNYIKENENTTLSKLSSKEIEELFNKVILKWVESGNTKANVEIIKEIAIPIILEKCKYKNAYDFTTESFIKRFRQYVSGSDDQNASKMREAEEWKYPNEYWTTNYDAINERRINEEIKKVSPEVKDETPKPPVDTMIKKRKRDTELDSINSKKSKNSFVFKKEIQSKEKEEGFKEDNIEQQKELLKNLSMSQFKILIKKGAYNLLTARFEKQIELSEEEAQELGVEFVLKLSELGFLKGISYK
jgi:hypothetical protein